MHVTVCMYVFKADDLVLNSQSVCSSMDKTVSHAFRISQLPVLLSVLLSPHDLSFIHFGMTIISVFVQVVFRQSCRCDFMGVDCDISR